MPTSFNWGQSSLPTPNAKRYPPQEDAGAQDLAHIGKQLEESGFQPEQALTGGRTAHVVAGTYHNVPAVARLAPTAVATGDTHNIAAAAFAQTNLSPEILFSVAGATILRRILPGTTTFERPATPEQLGELLGKLAEQPPHRTTEGERLPELDTFLYPRLDGHALQDKAISAVTPTEETLRTARNLLSNLTEDLVRGCGIHGDTSRRNILHGHGRLWLIDPRGLNGDWHFDIAVAAWKARYNQSDTDRLIAAALANKERVEAWTYVAKAAQL
jgi:hypothetical protein